MARLLLLVPSATYKAPDFLAAAQRLGAEVVVASDVRQTLAKAMGDRALEIDLGDESAAVEAVARLHAHRPLDALVAVDDQGVMVAARAGERLGLRHNPPAAVAATRDKAAFRAALAAAVTAGATELRQPAHRRAGPGADVAALAAEVGLPVVVKPVSLSASRGVIRADDPDAAAAAARRTRSILADAGRPADEPLLVEAYIPGIEVAVEGLLRAGHLEVLALFDKPDPLEGPYFEETIYVTPSRLPPDTQRRVHRATAEAAAATGLREGPIHAELRIDPDGNPWILEMAARTIGGLCSRALRFPTGASLEEIVLRHALDLPVPLEGQEDASGVMMLPIPEGGTLREVRGQDEARAVPGITALEVSIPLGRPVRPLPEGDRYLGFLFARGGSPDEVEAALRTAHGRLEVVVDPLT